MQGTYKLKHVLDGKIEFVLFDRTNLKIKLFFYVLLCSNNKNIDFYFRTISRNVTPHKQIKLKLSTLLYNYLKKCQKKRTKCLSEKHDTEQRLQTAFENAKQKLGIIHRSRCPTPSLGEEIKALNPEAFNIIINLASSS